MTLSSKRLAAGAALAAFACVLLAGVFSPRSLAATATAVPPSGEAWYEAPVTGGGQDDPSCTLPTGCAPASVPVVAGEKTLQVGASGGRDRARSFVALDLTGLPTGALITGGTLTLPVLQSEDSGSFRPETASLIACLALGQVKDAQGGAPEDQPDYSCEPAARFVYDGKATPPTFTADLGPLAAGIATGGIAIVPSKAAQAEGATFQVAIPTVDHPAKEQITASLTYDEAPTFGPLPTEDAAPLFPPVSSGGATDAGGTDFSAGTSDPAPFTDDAVSPGLAQPPPAPPPAQVAQEPVAAGPVTEPVAAPVAMVPVGYAYPAVWLAPLALLGVAGALGRSLTGEIVLPDEGAAPSDLLGRLLAAVRNPH